MKYSLAVVSTLAVAVSAVPQGSLTTLLGSLPPCSLTCATNQLPAVTACGGTEAPNLVECLCKNQEFQKSFASCAEGPGACDAKGQCDLYTSSVKMCGDAGVDTSSIPKPKDTSSCPAANKGGNGGGSSASASPSASSPAASSPAASSPAASSPAESSPAATTPPESSPAATGSASGSAAPTAAPTGAAGNGTSTGGAAAPTYTPSSASSVAVSGFAAILAGVAAILAL